MRKKITLVTDGACSGNPGPGGWAALLRYKDNEKLITGGDPETTNNRMELLAIVEGLRAIKEPAEVNIVSDSKYVIDAFEKGWLENWMRTGWKTSANKPVKNKELWLDLHREVQRHKISWTWVKGHAGHEDNERVDQAAREEASRQKL